ncbi:MAG: LuxR C-terminal-related transcriptional regulator [Solirubrobacteraceae bacterium]
MTAVEAARSEWVVQARRCAARPAEIGLLVASDIRLYREGLVDRLRRIAELEIVGLAANPAATIAETARLRPDLVLLDFAMTQPRRIVRRLSPFAGVVVLGVREEQDDVIGYAEAGALGYVTREASLDELVGVIASVAEGELRCSPRIAALLRDRVAEKAGVRPEAEFATRLTSRELEVAELLAEGLANKQIAGQLSIEVPTVKNHVHSILDKLEVKSRRDVARLVLDQRV